MEGQVVVVVVWKEISYVLWLAFLNLGRKDGNGRTGTRKRRTEGMGVE
jgi:hypothetical protein